MVQQVIELGLVSEATKGWLGMLVEFSPSGGECSPDSQYTETSEGIFSCSP